jgi:hypothetical protein
MEFRDERSKQEYLKWKKEDDIEQARIKERLEAPIKAAKIREEFEATANKVFTQARKLALYGNDDRVFVSPRVLGILRGEEPMTQEQLNSFAAAEAQAFRDANSEFAERFNNPTNIDLIIGMYQQRGFDVCCRDMLKSAFLLLRRDGLLEENPKIVPVRQVPVSQVQQDIQPDWDALPRLPISWQSPIAYKRDEHEQTFTGTDPNTGNPVTLTAREVDLLSAADYKAIFSVPATHLGKYSFGRR